MLVRTFLLLTTYSVHPKGIWQRSGKRRRVSCPARASRPLNHSRAAAARMHEPRTQWRKNGWSGNICAGTTAPPRGTVSRTWQPTLLSTGHTLRRRRHNGHHHGPSLFLSTERRFLRPYVAGNWLRWAFLFVAVCFVGGADTATHLYYYEYNRRRWPISGHMVCPSRPAAAGPIVLCRHFG